MDLGHRAVRPSSMAWHAGGKRGEPGGSISSWAWVPMGSGERGPGTRAFPPPWRRGERLWAPVSGRPRAFASWQRKMNRWEAPRREGNQGERVTAGSRPARQKPWTRRAPTTWLVGFGCPQATVSRGTLSPGWWQGEGPRLDVYIYIYVCMSPGQRSPVHSRLRGLGWKVVWLPVEHPLDIYLHPMK